MRLLACGETGLLAEVDSADAVRRLYAALRADPPPGLVELVPAARTVFVGFDPAATDAARTGGHLRGLRPGLPQRETREPVEVQVRYDGPDLDAVARASGLDPAEVAARHAAGTYEVAFCGFAPGFAYLSGLDPALHVPRRDTPRTRVPAGAVGLAGEHTGIYPRAGPGGWQLIGRTQLVLWDVRRDPPALLAPGTPVRFVAQQPATGSA